MMIKMMVIIRTMTIRTRTMMNDLREMIIFIPGNLGVAPQEAVVEVGPADAVVIAIDMV